MTEARHRQRWPRAIYWVIGAAIALTGALAARLIADAAPAAMRVPIWLGGAAMILVGLGVLSLGTRSHLEDDPPSSVNGSGN